MLNLDTHVLVFALTGDLTPAEVRLLTADSWSISAIVLWELTKLAQIGRIEFDPDSAEFTRLFARIHVWPVGLAVARQSVQLDFRGDPADDLIAATSVVHRIPLVTRDRVIRRSRVVPIAR